MNRLIPALAPHLASPLAPRLGPRLALCLVLSLLPFLLPATALGSTNGSFWASLSKAASRIDGAQLAFLATGQGFEELGVDAETRYRLSSEAPAEEQLAELGDEMALLESFFPDLSEPWRATFAQFSLNLAHSRGLAAEALEPLGNSERKHAVDLLEKILEGQTPPGLAGPLPAAGKIDEASAESTSSGDTSAEGRSSGDTSLDRAALDCASLARAALGLLVAVDSYLDLQPSEPLGLAWRTDVAGVSGPALGPIPTSAGPLYIGGPGKNRWEVGEAIILELGGDDTYQLSAPAIPLAGGASLTVIVDLAGDDTYTGTSRGALAGAIFGLSLLRDLGGDDTYHGESLTQGAGWFGVGMLVDDLGNDQYHAGSFSQGAAGFGFGLLADGSGADRYHARSAAQGFGTTFGSGVLADRDGDDLYSRCGRPDSSELPADAPGTSVVWDGGGNNLLDPLPVCKGEVKVKHHHMSGLYRDSLSSNPLGSNPGGLEKLESTP